ncbi:ATP-binding protein [Prosthecomicrobium hirschii]|uniref:ATP-binding protein n=1 Tax=Prosthecodimorpha hirschii TaxID=665126 RepID=UPI00221F8F3A|nr:ATP-binding protein [Prosthecomicrobium hirschii]MCW1841527.1 ATP-binding protein [Prosthecomicrobium hirschii]
MKRVVRLLPRGIAGQVGVLMAVAVLATALVGGLAGYRFGARPAGTDNPIIRIGGFMTVIRLLIAEPDPDAVAVVIATANKTFPGFDFELIDSAAVPLPPPADARRTSTPEAPPPGAAGAPGTPGEPGPPGFPNPIFGPDLGEFLRRDLGVERVIVEMSTQGKPGRIIIPIAGNRAVRATFPASPAPFGNFGPFRGPDAGRIVSILLLGVLATVLLSLWAAFWLTRPLRELAEATERFEPDRPHEPITESGPAEVRKAARALNLLRDRVSHLIAQHARTLAAVGHDLRTPITRLRLKVEFVEDPSLKRALEGDLDRMSAMVEGALNYLRAGHSGAERQRVDLAALVQTVADSVAETGGDVVCELTSGRTPIVADVSSLERAFSNLIENALRYGNRCEVGMTLAPGEARVTVDDDGPGIAEAQRERMMEPFVRGDEARPAGASEGFGLGLSIASAVIADHGGRIAFEDLIPQGLRVVVSLPLATPDAAG